MRWESASLYWLVALGIAAVLFVTGASLVAAAVATLIAFALMLGVAWAVGILSTD